MQLNEATTHLRKNVVLRGLEGFYIKGSKAFLSALKCAKNHETDITNLFALLSDNIMGKYEKC